MRPSTRPHLARVLPRGRLAAAAASAVLGAMEHTIPTAAKLDAWLEKMQPDAMVATPLVDFNSSQIDHVKGARAKGIPVALAVASWDNLTNKGVIAVQPDRVLVWNQPQADEAVTLHGTPRAERPRDRRAALRRVVRGPALRIARGFLP